MHRLYLLPALGLLFVALSVRAELVDDDLPVRRPKPKQDSDNDPNQAVERLPLIIDEPGFKAKVVFPERPVPKIDDESRPGKVSKPLNTRRTWALPQEEGIEPGAATENPTEPVADTKDQNEQASPALAKVIAKDHSGKKLKDVLPLYKEVAAAEPESAAAHYRYGLALARNGETRAAAQEMELAVNLQPRNSKYMCDFGLVALQAGWLEKALMACQSAAVTQPANPRYQSALGDCFLGTGRVTQAADAYQRAVNLAPDNAEYVHNLALANLHGSAFKKCIEIVNEAIRLRPDHAQYYCTRGLAQENSKNIKGAIEDYKHAILVDKNHAYARYLIACVYSDPKDPTFTSAFEAIENANMAVKLTQGRNAQYLMGLARAMRVGRSYDLAVDAARRAVALDPREAYKKELAQYEQLKGESITNLKP